ncbi:MAG: gliding motility protein GldL [Paludibacter sp.]|jgi:gliding motility-associated protein GldL|nr:gliding motility protein GldL [Paludibacter sp.]
MNFKEFDAWWALPGTKRIVGAVYSLGAAVVIIGAMFKILHITGANQVLMVGMITESVLFALGAFDKPFEEAHWSKIFDFKKGGFINNGLAGGSGGALGISSPLNEDDTKKLSESIKNLTTTAGNIASISNVVKSSDKLIANLDTASDATGKFIASQEALNSAAGKLDASYQSIYANMEIASRSTKTYGSNVEEVNKVLSSINTIYSIQLQNIKAQSEALAKQTEAIETASKEFSAISEGLKNVKASTGAATEQTAAFVSGTEKLAKQISDLNTVYGNMLNALH